MTNPTTRLARISADTGLSINEAEQYLHKGFIQFDKPTGKYYIWTPTQEEFHPNPIDVKPLTKADEDWLCR